MQRRDFLKATGAVGLTATMGQALRTAHAAEAPKGDATPAFSIERIADDRFAMKFAPAEPRSLRVLQITDTHFGSVGENARRGDERSFEEIRRLVEEERPDFVVHTGDFINNDQGPSVSFEAIEFMDSLGVPWTHALGNHDIGSRQVDEFRRSMKHAAVGEFRSGDAKEYAFRFDLTVGDSSEPTWLIYCFDSGFRNPLRHVSRPQIEWFERQMRRDADEGLACPTLAMIHIPVIEFEKLRAADKHTGIFGERVCYDTDQGETFAAFRKSGRVKAVFSGHDHKNDYHGVWEGVELVYGRVGGWSAYGDLKRGGRLIEIDPAAGTYSHRLVFPG